jgi:hypothetical protein
MLKMKAACERCANALPAAASTAYICSFECTFCEACTRGMNGVCPNCGGELARRPARTRSPASAGASQLGARLRRLVGR